MRQSVNLTATIGRPMKGGAAKRGLASAAVAKAAVAKAALAKGAAATGAAAILVAACALWTAARAEPAAAPGAARVESAATLELLMVEQAGCHYCDQWDAEVGVVYAKTAEGARAPLRRINIRDVRDAGLELKSRPRYTPTFILIADGGELGRIEGYPGEDFFWGLLQQLQEKALGPAAADAGGPT